MTKKSRLFLMFLIISPSDQAQPQVCISQHVNQVLAEIVLGVGICMRDRVRQE